MQFRIQLLGFISIVSLLLQTSPLIANDEEGQLIMEENSHYDDKNRNKETAQEFSAWEDDSVNAAISTDASNDSLNSIDISPNQTKQETSTQTGAMMESERVKKVYQEGTAEDRQRQIEHSLNKEMDTFLENAAKDPSLERDPTKKDISDPIATRQVLAELGFAYIAGSGGKFQERFLTALKKDCVESTAFFSDKKDSLFLRITPDLPQKSKASDLFDQAANIFLADEEFVSNTGLNTIVVKDQGRDLFKKFLYRYMDTVIRALFPTDLRIGNLTRGGFVWKRLITPITNWIFHEKSPPYTLPLLSGEQVVRRIIAHDTKQWNQGLSDRKKNNYLLNQLETDAEQISYELYATLREILDNPDTHDAFIVKLHQASYLFLYQYVASTVDTTYIPVSLLNKLAEYCQLGLVGSAASFVSDHLKAWIQETKVFDTPSVLGDLYKSNYQESRDQKIISGLMLPTTIPERLLLKIALVNFCNAVYALSFEEELQQTQALEKIEKERPADYWNQILFDPEKEGQALWKSTGNMRWLISSIPQLIKKTTAALDPHLGIKYKKKLDKLQRILDRR